MPNGSVAFIEMPSRLLSEMFSAGTGKKQNGIDKDGRLNLQQARREIVRQAFCNLGIVHQRLAEEMADSFTCMREEMVELFPGVIETNLPSIQRFIKILSL
jgi:hypothetical protein